jgi:uncharacterized membrane protein (UPF0182 family)
MMTPEQRRAVKELNFKLSSLLESPAWEVLLEKVTRKALDLARNADTISNNDDVTRQAYRMAYIAGMLFVADIPKLAAADLEVKPSYEDTLFDV